VPAVRACSDSLGSLPTPRPESGEGVITVVADPYGALFVDGVARGDTPGECRVAAGTYTLRVVHPELGARETRVTVEPGARVRWAADLLAR
jgi:hypothetical protein